MIFQILHSGQNVLNTTRGEVVITVGARAKFNGTYSKSNFVPIKSRVTLYCKVWLNKTQEHLFDLMLVTFTLPNGEQVVSGKCSVDYKHSCKRCKIVMKKVTLSDQGRYRCHAQYFSGLKIMKKYKDIFLRKYFCKGNFFITMYKLKLLRQKNSILKLNFRRNRNSSCRHPQIEAEIVVQGLNISLQTVNEITTDQSCINSKHEEYRREELSL